MLILNHMDLMVGQADTGSIADWVGPYFGSLYEAVPQPWSSILVVLCSMICGLMLGLERRSRSKPAGLRTMALICVGSTIYTLVSMLIVGDSGDDRGRVAAQVVTGIGFLGAGAIIRDSGHVVGMTTGATIWMVAAIGMLVGIGYGLPGIGLTLLVLTMLTLFRKEEN